VGVEPAHLTGCGRCRWCRRGDVQLCPELGQVGGQPVHSTGFAEYSLESADMCYPLTAALPMEQAAILDVYAVAVHAVHRVPVRPMDAIAVLGTGPIGLATAQVARAAGAGQVIVVGRREAPLALSRALGCDATVDSSREELKSAVLALTEGRGADVVYETVGGQAPTLGQSFEIAARGGRIGVVGMFGAPQAVDSGLCMRKELSLHWVWSYGRWEGVPEFQIALEMMVAGAVDPTPLITHRYPLSEIGAAFAAADDKRRSGAVKVLVIP
jgi:threonine dehydrogenase-like Zn-dependent dehydrogenase